MAGMGTITKFQCSTWRGGNLFEEIRQCTWKTIIWSRFAFFVKSLLVRPHFLDIYYVLSLAICSLLRNFINFEIINLTFSKRIIHKCHCSNVSEDTPRQQVGLILTKGQTYGTVLSLCYYFTLTNWFIYLFFI